MAGRGPTLGSILCGALCLRRSNPGAPAMARLCRWAHGGHRRTTLVGACRCWAPEAGSGPRSAAQSPCPLRAGTALGQAERALIRALILPLSQGPWELGRAGALLASLPLALIYISPLRSWRACQGSEAHPSVPHSGQEGEVRVRCRTEPHSELPLRRVATRGVAGGR